MISCIRSTSLLLLPGMMCDERLWRHQCAALADCAEVTVGSLVGANSIQGLAQGLLHRAPPRFALAGLSMGGIVALAMWRLAPERIAGLALLDTNYLPDPASRRLLRAQQIATVQAGGLTAVLRDELKPNYLAASHKHNSSLLDEVLQMGEDLGAEVFEQQSLALRDRPDSSATLATISCPTLVLCGAEDQLCPPELHRHMADRIANAQLTIVPDCGHLATLEQPHSVNRAMRAWLQTITGE